MQFKNMSFGLLIFQLHSIKSFIEKKSKGEDSYCNPLNKFIKCYQELEITHMQLENGLLFLNFAAFNEQFNLVLHAVSEGNGRYIFNDHLKVTVVDDSTFSYIYNFTDYFQGFVKGIHNSEVRGYFMHDIFVGEIQMPAETYYVENSRKYFRDLLKQNMIIYRDSDINFWNFYKNNVSNLIPTTEICDENATDCLQDFPKYFSTRDKYYNFMKANITKNKSKRSTEDEECAHVCRLKIVADYSFFKNVGLDNVNVTVAEMVFYITESSKIFLKTDFDGDKKPDNVGFSIKSVVIYKSKDNSEKLFGTTTDGTALLDLFASYNHDDFCLAILFTYRDFGGGALGLSYVASSSLYGNFPGGICQKRLTYRKRKMSFNALVVSSINFNKKVPSKLTSLTTAHELGHSFGAPHDILEADKTIVDARCAPKGEYGNYLMYPFSTKGVNENNYKFSPCSLDYMGPVIENKFHLCSRDIDLSTCGNQLIEGDEECDCGKMPNMCELYDHCCTHYDFFNDKVGCKIARNHGYVCSPHKSRCCDAATCHVQKRGKICREKTECVRQAFCDGIHFECPREIQEPNGKPCNGGSQVCKDGKCQQGICEYHGLKQCQCTSTESAMCEICCSCPSLPSSSAGCVPAWMLEIIDADGDRIHRIAGTPCNDYKGFCDIQHKCIRSDYDETMREIDMIAARTGDEIIKENIMNYWPLSIFLGIVFGVVIIAIYQDQKNKRIIAALPDPETMRDLLHTAVYYRMKELDDQLNRLQERYMKLIEKLKSPKRINHNTQKQMFLLFPTLKKKEIKDIMKSLEFTTDEEIVEFFLSKEYPIRDLMPTRRRVVRLL